VNKFGSIRLYSDSNNNPMMGQFVDALMTSIINVLDFIGLCGNNCKDDGTTFLDSVNCSSGHLMLLHKILPQVMARKPLML
jgi:hypothetical protein